MEFVLISPRLHRAVPIDHILPGIAPIGYEQIHELVRQRDLSLGKYTLRLPFQEHRLCIFSLHRNALYRRIYMQDPPVQVYVSQL